MDKVKPTSGVERAAAESVAAGFAAAGKPAHIEFTDPALISRWTVPIVAFVARVAAASLGYKFAGFSMSLLGALALALSLPGNPRIRSNLLASFPPFARPTSVVWCQVRSAQTTDQPCIVVAIPLDTVRTQRSRAAAYLGTLAAAAALATCITGRIELALFAIIASLVALAGNWGTTTTPAVTLVIGELAKKMADTRRDIYLVACGATTTSRSALTRFLRKNPDVAADAWCIVPVRSQTDFVRPVTQKIPPGNTSPIFARTLVGAALETGSLLVLSNPASAVGLSATALALRLDTLELHFTDSALASRAIVKLARTLL